MALSKGAQKIKKAYERLQYLSKDEKAKMEFDEYREAEIREYVDRYYARKEGHDEGYNEGLEEGREVGLTQGLAEGRAEGRKEGHSAGLKEGEQKNKIEVAKEMLKENIPIESIMKFTKLTGEEIKSLKKDL